MTAGSTALQAEMKPVKPSKLAKAINDLRGGLARAPLWTMLAWQEIRLRYRRSTLGPFWLTISAGALIGAMGPLYGRLFNQDLSIYFPHLAVSYVLWMLISTLINESCTVFINAEGLIKQLSLPLSVHIYRLVYRNVLIFLHHAVILVLVILIYPPKPSWQLLLLPIGLLLIALNGVWVAMVLGTLCARFRDVPQIVQSVVQVLLFVTPIMWPPEALGRYQWAGHWNPLNFFLEIIRAPLLGKPFPLLGWLGVFAVTLVGFALATTLFARYRARIAYWV